MKKNILLFCIFFFIKGFAQSPKVTLNPKKICKSSHKAYLIQNKGVLKVDVKIKYFQDLDTNFLKYYFIYDNLKTSKLKKFRIIYDKLNIDLLVDKNMEFIVKNNKCLSKPIKLDRATYENLYWRCHYVPPFNLNRFFMETYKNLNSSSEIIIIDSFKIIESQIVDGRVKYIFDSSNFLSTFEFIRNANIIEPGIEYQKWEISNELFLKNIINRFLDKETFFEDCKDTLTFYKDSLSDDLIYFDYIDFIKKITGEELINQKYKYLVVDYWYAACVPCLKSFNILDEVDKRQDTKVISINIYDSDSLNLHRYLQSKSFSLKSFFLINYKSTNPPHKIESCPTFILINNHTKEIKKVIGYEKKSNKIFREFLR